MNTHTCKNCSTNFSGKFCPECGEKVLTANDFKLKTFVMQGVDIFTHVDSKFTKTLFSLFKKPGELTLNNWNGIRVAFAKPIQLFFVLNALFYLLNSTTVHFNIFNTPLENQLKYFSYSDYASTETEKALKENNFTFEEYQTKFNEKSDKLSKSLIFIMIPIQALLLWLVFFRKKPYYVQHLIFATHYFSFVIIYCLLMIAMTVCFVLVQQIIPNINATNYLNDRTFSLLGIVFMSYYYFNAFKRCFNLKFLYNVIATGFFVFSMYYVLELYRFILYLIVRQSI
jgi:Protein of unknown function (DUF3667)